MKGNEFSSYTLKGWIRYFLYALRDNTKIQIYFSKIPLERKLVHNVTIEKAYDFDIFYSIENPVIEYSVNDYVFYIKSNYDILVSSWSQVPNSGPNANNITACN